MREELQPTLEHNGCKIGYAVELVEEEVAKWRCESYMHITRATGISGNTEEAGTQKIHLETIFSKPAQDRPVPAAVVYVFFELNTDTKEITYHFEHENVRHVVGGSCLGADKYESWLDRLIGDKMQVRRLHDLATSFEEKRLEPPPLVTSDPSALAEQVVKDDESDDTSERLATKAITESLNPTADLPLSELLSNIFDAADEGNEYELTHKEVADLVYATPLGLTDWDVKLLLTTASELDTGRIQYQTFVDAAPQIVESLLRRRANFNQKHGELTQVSWEAIDLCYGEEIEEVARSAREAFAAQDSTSKGTLSRHVFRTCLESRSERLASQEVQLLMQMCTEDDFLQVPYDDFATLLQQLRIDALHNAVVETDVGALRAHLVQLIRRTGALNGACIMPIWTLRDVLLHADQLCLSRMQIHAIMCIVHPDEHGDVDVEYFLRVCCTVIPSMFDTTAFMEKAATIKREKEDLQARQELEELQGLSNNLAKKRADEDEEAEVQNAPDRDAVEKTLIHIGNSFDDKIRAQPTLDVARFVEAMRHESVQQCQLSEAELRGFIAEAAIDERGEIAYVEHVKMWVPILLEMRKSRLYDQILSVDWGMDAAHLVDLREYALKFPLLSDGAADNGSGSRPGSARRGRTNSYSKQRRPSSRMRMQRSDSGENTPDASPARSGSKYRMRSRSRSGSSVNLVF